MLVLPCDDAGAFVPPIGCPLFSDCRLWAFNWSAMLSCELAPRLEPYVCDTVRLDSATSKFFAVARNFAAEIEREKTSARTGRHAPE